MLLGNATLKGGVYDTFEDGILPADLTAPVLVLYWHLKRKQPLGTL